MSSLVLPPLLDYDPHTQTPQQFAEVAYARFRSDIVGQSFVIERYSVIVVDDGKCLSNGTAFWHLATMQDGVRGRYPVPRRCQFVPWIAPMLRASGSGELNEWWNERRGGRGREQGRLLSTPGDDFCVVLREGNNGRLYLLTAYPVDKERDRHRMRREREQG